MSDRVVLSLEVHLDEQADGDVLFKVLGPYPFERHELVSFLKAVERYVERKASRTGTSLSLGDGWYEKATEPE